MPEVKMAEPLVPEEGSVKPFTGPLVPLLPAKADDDRRLPRLLRKRDRVELGCSEWTVQTVVTPAAFPRSVKDSTRRRGQPEETAFDGSKDRIDVKRVATDMMHAQIESVRAQVATHDEKELREQEQLYVAANRYSRGVSPAEGLTLVFCHANGLHKETWEPTISELLKKETTPISEIWTLDASNQGDSGVLNHEIIGPAYNWVDNGRDLLNFLINYIDAPELASTADPSLSHGGDATGTILTARPLDASLTKLDSVPRQPSRESKPAQRKYGQRRIVGIGHSLGGGALAFAATTMPDLFAGLVFVDPVIVSYLFERSIPGSLATGALTRKDGWPSKEEAKQSFLSKPFFKAWDSRVLDLYIEAGLKQVKGGYRLKCRPKDEALTFLDPNTSASYRAFTRLHMIPSALPAHFVLARPEASVQSLDNEAKIAQQMPHATRVRVDCGHLIAQENPGLLADQIASCLSKWFPADQRSKAKL